MDTEDKIAFTISTLFIVIVVAHFIQYRSTCPHFEYTQDSYGNCYARDNCERWPNWTSIPCK